MVHMFFKFSKKINMPYLQIKRNKIVGVRGGDKCIYSVKKENAKMALDDEMEDLKPKIVSPPPP